MAEQLLVWIQFGIDTEQKSIDFYSQCLKKVRHPIAIEIFDYLVRVEKSHKKILETLLEQEAKGDKRRIEESIGAFFRLQIKNPLFPTEEVEDMLKPTATLVGMLNKALELENTGMEFYNKVAKEEKDPKVKALFLRLAADEKDHKKELTDLGYYVFGVPPEADFP
jgi:rubrerythrin